MTICVVGLEQEAEIIRQLYPDAVIVVGAGDAAALASKLEAAIAAGAGRSSNWHMRRSRPRLAGRRCHSRRQCRLWRWRRAM